MTQSLSGNDSEQKTVSAILRTVRGLFPGVYRDPVETNAPKPMYEGNFISDRFLPRIFRMDASREIILCNSQLCLTKNELAYSGNPSYIPS